MRAYIVDDLQTSVDTLIYLLKTYCPEVEILGATGDIDEATLQIKRSAIDIIFLDINLANNRTAFDLLDRLPRFKGNIIVVTAHEEYALTAFKYDAIHYLLKPINVTELCDAVGRVMKKKAELLFKDKTVIQHDTILFNNRNGVDILNVKNIVYLEGSGSYTKIFMVHNTEIRVSKNLKSVFSMLSEYTEFMKVHKSYVSNTHYISNFIRKPKPMLELEGKYQIPISREYKEDVLRSIEHFFTPDKLL